MWISKDAIGCTVVATAIHSGVADIVEMVLDSMRDTLTIDQVQHLKLCQTAVSRPLVISVYRASSIARHNTSVTAVVPDSPTIERSCMNHHCCAPRSLYMLPSGPSFTAICFSSHAQFGSISALK